MSVCNMRALTIVKNVSIQLDHPTPADADKPKRLRIMGSAISFIVATALEVIQKAALGSMKLDLFLS